MRIVYMGTPQFAVPPLEALAAGAHDVAAVVTRTDKPAGRGRSLAAPPVKLAAQRLGIAVHQPKRVREPQFVDVLRGIGPDIIIVAAYGQILPKDILTLPKHGCVNIHASLLPRYRGAAPVNWAIIRGEQETGVTLMQMDEGMDTGAILRQERIPIGPADTAGSLIERLSLLGARMIAEALPLIGSGSLRAVPQDEAGATLAPILKKEDGMIDWTHPAAEIEARVRGLDPWPGAQTSLNGLLVKITAAAVRSGTAEPGLLLQPDRNTLAVGTGRDLLEIIGIQPAGKRPMAAAEFLRGHRGVAGKRFSMSDTREA